MSANSVLYGAALGAGVPSVDLVEIVVKIDTTDRASQTSSSDKFGSLCSSLTESQA